MTVVSAPCLLCCSIYCVGHHNLPYQADPPACCGAAAAAAFPLAASYFGSVYPSVNRSCLAPARNHCTFPNVIVCKHGKHNTPQHTTTHHNTTQQHHALALALALTLLQLEAVDPQPAAASSIRALTCRHWPPASAGKQLARLLHIALHTCKITHRLDLTPAPAPVLTAGAQAQPYHTRPSILHVA
jgi:hypothetical protein